jgi:branched-chain amino acid transport system substrate-binding protein
MTWMGRWRVPSLALATLWGVLACSGGRSPIVIGVTGPFSQPRGVSMKLAAEMARDEINAAGGAGGRPIELRFIDDSASPDAAVRAAQAFVQDRSVVAVVGHLTSGATLAAAPVYDGSANPLPMVTPSASSPEITRAGKYIFRVCPSDLMHGMQLGEFAAQQLGARRVAILYHNDGYGRGVRGSFAIRFRARGGTVAFESPYLPDPFTVPVYLERVARGGGIDAVFIGGNRAEAERILRAMDSLDIDLPVLGADGMSGTVLPAGMASPVYVSSMYTADRPETRSREFVAAYGRRYEGRAPDHRGAAAYDIVHLLARAVESAGANRADLRDYLADVGTASEAFDGVIGPIAFDENGDVRGGRVDVMSVRR